jgi:hypothetical protein
MDNQIIVSWTVAADIFVDNYDVQYKLSSDAVTLYKSAAVARNATQVLIQGFDVNTNYDFRIRSVNTRGIVSSWVEQLNKQISDLNYIYYQTYFDSLDGYLINNPNMVTLNGEGLLFTSVTPWPAISVRKSPTHIGSATWAKNRIFKIRAKLSGGTTETLSMGMGDNATFRHALFRFEIGGGIACRNGNGTTFTLTATGLTATLGQYYNFEIRTYPAVPKIEYYVDSILKVTITTDNPLDAVDSNSVFFIAANSNATADYQLLVTDLSFLQKN